MIHKIRQLLAVLGSLLVAFLIFNNWPLLFDAVTESPTTLVIGFGFGSISLLIQAAGFRTFPRVASVSPVQMSDIWCSAIIFNHIFPLAGGLGYRFVALKVKGIELKDTGRATLWFLATSASTAVASLIVIYLATEVSPVIAFLLVISLLSVVPLFSRRLVNGEPTFVYMMISYQIAQVFFMGFLVIYAAKLGGLELSISQGAALGGVMRLGSLISLTPAGLGIQEAIIIGVLAGYGVTTEDSTGTAVMVRVMYLISAITITLLSRGLLATNGPQLPSTPETVGGSSSTP